MTVVAVGSVHGAPGATTAAVLLAAVWPAAGADGAGGGDGQGDGELTDRVVVEADPAGGVLAARYGLAGEPGLARLAAAADQRLDAGRLWGCVQRLSGGLPVVVGPVSPSAAGRVVGSAGRRLAGRLADLEEVTVVVDCGRLQPGSPAMPVVGEADVVLVVARPDAEQAPAAASRARQLDGEGRPAAVLLVGDDPYGPAEIVEELEVSVAGVLVDDPRGAAVVAGQAAAPRWGSTRLQASARKVAGAVAARTDPGGSNGGGWTALRRPDDAKVDR